MTNMSCALIGQHPMRFQFGYDEDDALCHRIKLEMIRQILILYQNGVTDFFTNCETGPPMWGAEAIIALMDKLKTIRLFCAIPYEEQATKWTPDLRDRYFNILEKCTDSCYIQKQLTQDSYRLCGNYLVEHSNFVLAVYNTKITTTLDPVTAIVNDAKEAGKGIIYIHPDTARVTPIRIEAYGCNGDLY